MAAENPDAGATRDTVVGPRTTNEAMNLNSAATSTTPWTLSTNRVSLQAISMTGTWATAVLYLQASLDGQNWDQILTISAAGFYRNIKTTGYFALRLYQQTAEGSAATALFVMRPYNVDADDDLEILAQSRPTGITAVSAYTPTISDEARIYSIHVCNTTSAGANASVYLDNDGDTYDADSLMVNAAPVEAKGTYPIECGQRGWPMRNSAGNLAIQSSVANALNFTIIGRTR